MPSRRTANSAGGTVLIVSTVLETVNIMGVPQDLIGAKWLIDYLGLNWTPIYLSGIVFSALWLGAYNWEWLKKRLKVSIPAPNEPLIDTISYIMHLSMASDPDANASKLIAIRNLQLSSRTGKLIIFGTNTFNGEFVRIPTFYWGALAIKVLDGRGGQSVCAVRVDDEAVEYRNLATNRSRVREIWPELRVSEFGRGRSRV